MQADKAHTHTCLLGLHQTLFTHKPNLNISTQPLPTCPSIIPYPTNTHPTHPLHIPPTLTHTAHHTPPCQQSKTQSSRCLAMLIPHLLSQRRHLSQPYIAYQNPKPHFQVPTPNQTTPSTIPLPQQHQLQPIAAVTLGAGPCAHRPGMCDILGFGFPLRGGYCSV